MKRRIFTDSGIYYKLDEKGYGIPLYKSWKVVGSVGSFGGEVSSGSSSSSEE
jgi:hypothetical protein